MKLFSFWRSLATYRVRIALNRKGLTPDEVIQVNLMKGEQHAASYRAVNPMMAIPALIDGDGPALFESLAIIEYLDETHPSPPLLPHDPRGRARVRGLSQIVACDSHPLVVPRVREYLEREFSLDEAAVTAWCRHWHAAALTAIEARLQDTSTGRYAHGDTVTLADICLASQAAGATFFSIDMAPFPTFGRIVDELSIIDAFARAHPLRQPGAPAST
jgi:maleylacetoacetate isomerase